MLKKLLVTAVAALVMMTIYILECGVFAVSVARGHYGVAFIPVGWTLVAANVILIIASTYLAIRLNPVVDGYLYWSLDTAIRIMFLFGFIWATLAGAAMVLEHFPTINLKHLQYGAAITGCVVTFAAYYALFMRTAKDTTQPTA